MHGDETADHGDMLGAPALVDIIEKLVAACAANVDIDVGAIATLFVEEPLKVQLPSKWADPEIPRQYVTMELAAEPRAMAGMPRRRASSTMSQTRRKYGARFSFSITSSSCVSRASTSGRSGR